MNAVTKKKWLLAMQQGQAKFQQGQFRHAISYFIAATECFPAGVEGWLNLGVARLHAGMIEAALQSLQQAIALNPHLMMAHMAAGDAQRQLGNWEAAIHAYQRAVDLERTPASLNQLAGALRVAHHAPEAESLYQEALRMDPGFRLAQVNLATVQVEMRRFGKARQLLSTLKNLPLSELERNEVESTRLALEQYFLIQPALEQGAHKDDLEPLHKALRNVPPTMLSTDTRMLAVIRSYARSAKVLSPGPPLRPRSMLENWPEDWPLIEALFMHPSIESAADYQKARRELATNANPAGDLLKSANLQATICAIRAARPGLHDPIMAEAHLRHWHLLVSKKIEGMLAGHYKLTRNLARDSTMGRTDPHMVAGTIRAFFSEIHNRLQPGMERALVTFMAILDIHGFEDGNGRVGMSLLNRELEWGGEIPVLLRRNTTVSKQYFATIQALHNNGSDLSPLLKLVRKAQTFSLQLCEQLARS